MCVSCSFATMAASSTPSPAIDNDLLFDDETDVIRLNVGGKPFMTRAQTLAMAHSDYFDRIIKAATNNPKREFFIDRSPKLFAYMLEALRTNTLEGVPTSAYRTVWYELGFFGISSKQEPFDFIKTFLHHQFELIDTEGVSHFLPWTLWLKNVPNRILLAPTHIQLSHSALSHLRDAYHSPEKLYVLYTVENHLKELLDEDADDLAWLLPDLSQYETFVHMLGYKVSPAYYLQYWMAVHAILPSSDFDVAHYTKQNLINLVTTSGKTNPYCLDEWKLSRKVTTNNQTVEVSPIRTVYIYHFHNTNIVYATGLRDGVSLILESASQFAIYNSGCYHTEEVFKSDSKALRQRIGFYHGPLIAIGRDDCTIGYLNKGAMRFIFLKPSNESQSAYYKQCSLHQTYPPPSVDHGTSLYVLSVTVINYF